MKRPILIATIGYIIGIIVGLYFNKSIVLFYIPIIAIYLLRSKKIKDVKKLKLFSIKRYIRYLKIYLNSKVIILLILSSIISNSIVISRNKEYEKIYNNLSKEENIDLKAIITSNVEEKEYYNKYKIETKYNNKKISLYIMVNKNIKLKYGQEIKISGTYIRPEVQRNYKGFDYSQYLKQLKIYGTIKCSKIEKINQDKSNKLLKISNEIVKKIETNIKKVLKSEIASVLLGLMLGNKKDITQELQENFTNASMSHILAVSGMHVAFIILGTNIIFNKIIGKRKTNLLNIFILIIYMFITNFSPSITRAGIMGIIMIFSKIIYRRNDIYTSFSISLLTILIYNPFLIQNLGLILSFSGVLGIVTFNKNILKILKNIKVKNKLYEYKIRPKIQKNIDKIKEIISVSISVQIFIFPIVIYNLNTFNPYFLISNLILSIIIGPVVILGLIFIIAVLINRNLARMISLPIEIGIKILIFISKIGEMPFSKIYVATPKLFSILSYYLVIFILFHIYEIYSSRKPNKTQIRERNLIAILKIKSRKNKNKIKKIILVIVLTFVIANLIPQKLKIHFIDVGQGDSTLIVTPHNKKILIDGGGSASSSFDVGKNTLIPYILDRGFTQIDIAIISHFDVEHVDGVLRVLEELKVKKVYISKQIKDSKKYDEFLNITNRKNIKVHEVIAGNRIQIEKNLYFDVLWPQNRQISENVLNNNSIVCNLHYNNFSMLFTGDIEEIAENEILKLYSSNQKLLKSDILKVGHHGSRTSSTEEFLNIISPKVAVIGVGKNNNFGHPNGNVLTRLQVLNSVVYRTDLNGEIIIEVNSKSKYKIKTKCD
ncbi:MAG: DNA internalization-related competence protein ComEC/Rec2 [Clostridia bacterium]|nr:DNA internalization-related competence protein ComEC/Rec2 [Clostridia bacterium]